jgi:hypothetical protein
VRSKKKNEEVSTSLPIICLVPLIHALTIHPSTDTVLHLIVLCCYRLVCNLSVERSEWNCTQVYIKYWHSLCLQESITRFVTRVCKNTLPGAILTYFQLGILTKFMFTFMLPCIVIYFFLNNQTAAPIIQIYSVIKLYMFRVSSLPIIRSFALYIRHW